MQRVKGPVRVGLIGGGWAAWAHGQGYRQLPDLFRVRYVMDVDAGIAAERARDLPGARAVTNARAVLDDPDIDAVDICVPHDLHRPIAIAAAKAGKHVLMEKPLARSYAEGREIVAAAGAAGVQLMIAFNERHRWCMRTIKRLADEGRLGRVYMVRSDHHQNVVKPEGHWLRSKDRSGGGAVIGSGVHLLDLLRWFGGEVSEVFCTSFHMPDRLEGEVAASVTVTYAAGGIGTHDIMWATSGKPWYQFLAVYGTGGRATTFGTDVTFAPIDGGLDTLEMPKEGPFTDTFRDELKHFGECLLSGARPITDGADALKTQEIVEAAYRSAETRAVVRLPLAG